MTHFRLPMVVLSVLVLAGCRPPVPRPNLNASAIQVSAPVDGVVTITCTGPVADAKVYHFEFWDTRTTIYEKYGTGYQLGSRLQAPYTYDYIPANAQNRFDPITLGEKDRYYGNAMSPVQSGDAIEVRATGMAPGIFGGRDVIDYGPTVSVKVP